MSNSVRPHRWQPTRLPRPWDSPGKNTGVGCHFLLQCMKVKSESEVTQCPPLRDPMSCSLPGSSAHGIFQARVLEWVAIAFSKKSHIHTHIYTQRQQISLCCCQKLRKAVLTQYAQGVKITPFLFLESHAYKRKKKAQHKVNFPLTPSTSIIYQKLLVVLPSKGRNGLLRFIKCQKYIGQ